MPSASVIFAPAASTANTGCPPGQRTIQLMGTPASRLRRASSNRARERGWSSAKRCLSDLIREESRSRSIASRTVFPRGGSRRAPDPSRYPDSYVNVRIEDQPERSRFRPGVSAEHHNYKWWALSCTSLGMLLATINSGTLIIALPDLARSLGPGLLQLVWVTLAYMISSTVLVLTAGRLSDLFGRKKAYVGGFVVFTLASLGAGFSGNGTELILWRIVQGVGAAFLFANAAALVTDAFPKEQLGAAMGTNTMVAAIGLVIGPVLGGALVAISWEWVFWFNVPFALLGSLWAGVVLRELAKPDRVRGYDIPGVLLFVAGLTGLVFGLSRGGLNGWSDPLTIGGIVVGVVLLPA